MAPGAISAGPPAAASGGAAAAAVAPVYTFGREPLDDALFWGGPEGRLRADRGRAVAIMLAPTYPETGATGNSAPSPMTLSRFDTNSALYAFGDPGTTYPRAFLAPGRGGVGVRSAGGWNLTAAQAISTTTSAQQAAITMSARALLSVSTITDLAQRRASVWTPWHGCNGGVCEAIYQAIYADSGPKVQVDTTVTRNGGMVSRTCRVANVGQVPCSFVDPAKAQGFNGWNVPAWGRSPVSAPFYVYSLNGREAPGLAAQRHRLRRHHQRLQADHEQRPHRGSLGSRATRCARSPPTGVRATGPGRPPTAAPGRASRRWPPTPTVGSRCSPSRSTAACTTPGSWPERRVVGLGRIPRAHRREDIVASRGRDGFLVLAAVTSSGGLWQNTQRASGWAGWAKLGQGVVGSLAVARNQDGRAEVYGLDAGGSVWHRPWQLTTGGWSGLAQLGGHSITGLATANNQDGRIEVFAVGGDHAIYHVWQIGRNAPFSGPAAHGRGRCRARPPR